MSRAAANGDPSMDEILASIRKIIAEEPGAGRPVLEPRAPGPMPTPPAPPEKAAAEPASERPSAMFGRLAEALRGTRPSVAPRREPSVRLEDDLSDLIEAGPPMPPPSPARALPPTSPPPAARVSPASPPPAPVKVAAPGAPRPKQESDTWTGAYPRRPSQQIEPAREEPPKRGEPASAAPSAAPAVKVSTPGTPVREPSRPELQGASMDAAKVAKQETSSSPAVASAATRPAEKQGPAPNGGSMPPPSSARPAGIPVKPQVIAAMPPAGAPTPPGAPAKPSEAGKPPSAAVASNGASSQAAVPQKDPPLAPPPASKAVEASPAAAPLKPDTQKSLLPSSGEPKDQTQTGVRAAPDRSAASRSSEPPPAPARPLAGLPPINADTSAAAASALGALAAGLAASSNKPSGGVLPDPPPLPPLSLPPLAARLEAATPLPPALPASAAGHQTRATTSLEGLVSELLQPMLRQWLAEHLPRLVEEAVRTEVAANLKSGRPPRG